MNKLNKNGIIAVGGIAIGLVVAIILVAHFSFGFIPKKANDTDITNVTEQIDDNNLSDEPDVKLNYAKTTVNITQENNRGTFSIVFDNDKELVGGNQKINKIKLISPSQKEYIIDLNKKDDNVFLYDGMVSYVFNKPLDIGTWTIHCYGNNITDNSLSASIYLETNDDDYRG